MKKTVFLLLSLLLSALALLSASAQDELGRIHPEPVRSVLLKGSVRFAGIEFKCDPEMDYASAEMVKRFASRLGLVSGKVCAVSSPVGLRASVDAGEAKGLSFIVDPDMEDEQYSIAIGPRCSVVKASGLGGFVMAVQTLAQMLPEAIWGTVPAPSAGWRLPCCEIEDRPAAQIRCARLDCGRVFRRVPEIREFIDGMGRSKQNTLVWRLTDALGWRFEMEAYPLLAEISESHYGGYYSREDIAAVVDYAARTGITVVPELELEEGMRIPAAAYPALSGPEERTAFRIGVLRELASVFPSEMIAVVSPMEKSEEKECIKPKKLVNSQDLTAMMEL